MVCALDSGASAPGSSPGQGHCVVFLGKTLHPHSASLHPGVLMGTGEIDAGGNPMQLCWKWETTTTTTFIYVSNLK